MPMISRMRQRRVVRDQLSRADQTTRHQSGVFKDLLIVLNRPQPIGRPLLIAYIY